MLNFGLFLGFSFWGVEFADFKIEFSFFFEEAVAVIVPKAGVTLDFEEIGTYFYFEGLFGEDHIVYLLYFDLAVVGV